MPLHRAQNTNCSEFHFPPLCVNACSRRGVSRACDDDDLPAEDGGTGFVAQSGTRGIASFFGATTRASEQRMGKRKREDTEDAGDDDAAADAPRAKTGKSAAFVKRLGVSCCTRF
jgi:hypothetical protein